jgi:hypothetical protein
MFAPEFPQAHLGAPTEMSALHTLAYTSIPCGVKRYVRKPPNTPRNPDSDDSHSRRLVG